MGFRQHTSGYQHEDYPNVDLPVCFLDNDFRNPDREEFVDLVDRYEPDVAVIGDADSYSAAEQYQTVADELAAEYPDLEAVIAPKAREAFEAINSDTVLGWPNGYAGVDPLEYSTLDQWRGRPVHVLGGNPHDQLAVIDLLTQPTIDDQPPSNIVGVDGNGCFKAALYGEYWTPDGYAAADHLSLRETVNSSLQGIKQFWQDHGIWPSTEPADHYGPAVRTPDEGIWLDGGGDPIRSRGELEDAYLGEYEHGTYAFRSMKAKQFIEYREGWESV